MYCFVLVVYCFALVMYCFALKMYCFTLTTQFLQHLPIAMLKLETTVSYRPVRREERSGVSHIWRGLSSDEIGGTGQISTKAIRSSYPAASS
jgi:hypothetical protein